ncbi:MAG TPA: AMP-binding protein [Rubrivivax sp.]|nr:AMP-binding protein [Rubrivivax sp.]
MSKIPSYWASDLLLTEADVQRFESVPLAERRLPPSTYEMLMDGCAIDPAKVAIHFFTDGCRPVETARRVTYGELRTKLNQTANLLCELGIGKDDVVSVLMPAVPEALFALWGAQAAGIVNPANWMLEPEILVHMFRAAGTKVIVAYGGDENASPWPKLEAVVRQLPGLAAVVRVGGDTPCPASVAGVRVVDYATQVEQCRGDRLLSGRVFSPDDTASLFHTGGTTGAPKLARQLHRNQVFWSWASKYLTGIGSEEVRLIGVPVFHVAGAIVGGYAPLTRGASVVLMTSAGYRHPSVVPRLWKIVQAFRATTDEAYSLAKGSENDFGREAIDTLVKRMEDDRDDLVVILAGYTESMKTFVAANPGLASRFPQTVPFADYSVDDLISIFCGLVSANDYAIGDGFNDALRGHVQLLWNRRTESFGNARLMRNLFEATLQEQANRLASASDLDTDALGALTIEDVDAAARRFS